VNYIFEKFIVHGRGDRGDNTHHLPQVIFTQFHKKAEINDSFISAYGTYKQPTSTSSSKKAKNKDRIQNQTQ